MLDAEVWLVYSSFAEGPGDMNREVRVAGGGQMRCGPNRIPKAAVSHCRSIAEGGFAPSAALDLGLRYPG